MFLYSAYVKHILLINYVMCVCVFLLFLASFMSIILSWQLASPTETVHLVWKVAAQCILLTQNYMVRSTMKNNIIALGAWFDFPDLTI